MCLDFCMSSFGIGQTLDKAFEFADGIWTCFWDAALSCPSAGLGELSASLLNNLDHRIVAL